MSHWSSWGGFVAEEIFFRVEAADCAGIRRHPGEFLQESRLSELRRSRCPDNQQRSGRREGRLRRAGRRQRPAGAALPPPVGSIRRSRATWPYAQNTKGLPAIWGQPRRPHARTSPAKITAWASAPAMTRIEHSAESPHGGDVTAARPARGPLRSAKPQQNRRATPVPRKHRSLSARVAACSDEAMAREDIEDFEVPDRTTQLPDAAIRIHAEYTLYGHFFLRRRLLPGAERL